MIIAGFNNINESRILPGFKLFQTLFQFYSKLFSQYQNDEILKVSVLIPDASVYVYSKLDVEHLYRSINY